MSKFFVTTPIYYVNDAPHIGHAYTTILADVLSRYHRTAGDEVFFLTGLDEHGQKVKQAAKKRGLSPQAHCDDLSPRFLNLWKKLDIRYDDFIRTPEPRHKTGVQELWRRMEKQGDIYLDKYAGWYSVRDEAFYEESEITNGKAPAFNMSPYGDKLAPEDRWAVVAYVRALQRAQMGKIADVPPEHKPELGLK